MSDREERATEIDRLIAAGELLKAAAALRQSGALLRAQELYERAWDLESAAAVAGERGDHVGRLRIALLGGDAATLAALRDYFSAAGPEQQRAAAVLYEQHQLPIEAAMLREALDEPQAASELYQRGGAWLQVGRLAEHDGRLLQATDAYAAALRLQSASAAERLGACMGSGRVLFRAGRLAEALRHLQEARRVAQAEKSRFAQELDEVEARLIECLVAMGEVDVARPIHADYVVRHAQADRNGAFLSEPTASPVEFVQRRAERASGQTDTSLLLGRYQLLRLIGAGSMGRVYLAQDDAQQRQVALKLLPLAGAAGGAERQLYGRFCREAGILRGLRHPNLIELYDVYPAAGLLAMEYIPGGALDAAPLPLPLSLLRRLLQEVVEALLCVHSAGILHRDIKPHNLFLSPTGTAKLGDFGAASLRELGLTQTEGLVGTLAYMAPEQLRGDRLGFASDVYGLGVTAFELCTSRLPFPGPDFIEQHLSAPPPDARALRPELPAPWAVLLRQLLAKSQEDRCSDLESLREGLSALPTPALPDDSSSRAQSYDKEEPGACKNPTDVIIDTSLLFRTGHSALFLGTDPRLGRTVLIERFREGLLQGPAGAAHLLWLRGMARVSGPGLQRILRIDIHSQPSAQVHYEAPAGTPVSPSASLSAKEHAQATRLLARLHGAALVHGGVARALHREPAQLMLLISGQGPLSWSETPSPALDLRELQNLYLGSQ
jgi:serine/threonine-protein kinase